MIDISRAPFPVTYREIWLPKAVNGNATLQRSRHNGHDLALTGARKGSTVGGVHFDGTATSNMVVAADAVLNNQAKFWLCVRFKLDQPFSSTSPNDQYLYQKKLGNEYVRLYLESGDGRMYFAQGDGLGGNNFSLAPSNNTWAAHTWYTIIVSLTDTGAGIQRFLVNGVLLDSDTQAARNTPNGGDLIIGNSSDGAANGLEGTVSIVVDGTDDLTTDEETDLFNGIPPADAVNSWPLDEGRGVTAYDRGSGGNDGTLDTSAKWAWGSCKQPVLSLDGINDHGQSSAGVDISGNLTIVWAAKMKSRYEDTGDHWIFELYVDANNRISLRHTGVYWRPYFIGSGVSGGGVSDTTFPAIDSYMILILTLTLNGVWQYIKNGSLVEAGTGVGAVSGAAATAYIGCPQALGNYDVSKPLMVALIEGTFTQKQALAYSRWLNNILNIGIVI